MYLPPKINKFGTLVVENIALGVDLPILDLERERYLNATDLVSMNILAKSDENGLDVLIHRQEPRETVHRVRCDKRGVPYQISAVPVSLSDTGSDLGIEFADEIAKLRGVPSTLEDFINASDGQKHGRLQPKSSSHEALVADGEADIDGIACTNSPYVRENFPFIDRIKRKSFDEHLFFLRRYNLVDEEQVDYFKRARQDFFRSYKRGNDYGVAWIDLEQSWLNTTEYLITNKRFVSDPKTGEMLASRAIATYNRRNMSIVASFFETKDDIWVELSAGGYAACAYHLYSVRHKILIDIAPTPRNSWAWNKHIAISHKVIKDLVSNYTSITSEFDEIKRDFRLIHVNGSQNLGHFIWNEMPPLLGLVAGNNYPDRDTRVVTSQSKYMREFGFDQLLRNFGVDYDCQDDDRTIVVGAGKAFGHVIDADILRMVYEASAAAVNRERLDNILGASDGAAIIWLNVRDHNKRLENLNDLIGIIVEYVRRKYDLSCSFWIDGWPECEPLIQSAFEENPDAEYEILFGESLATVVELSKRAHVFFAPVGSGLVIPTWLAGRPGFAHGDLMHLQQARFWRNCSVQCHSDTFFADASMTFGGESGYADYSIDLEKARPLIGAAIDSGLANLLADRAE